MPYAHAHTEVKTVNCAPKRLNLDVTFRSMNHVSSVLLNQTAYTPAIQASTFQVMEEQGISLLWVAIQVDGEPIRALNFFDATKG
jgi:hypothetical protein